jgi:hypothetical protein
LGTVCYTVRKLPAFLSIEVLRIVYFANFQSLFEYGIIFCGNSSYTCHNFSPKKEYLELWLELLPDAHVALDLENWAFYLFRVCIFNY